MPVQLCSRYSRASYSEVSVKPTRRDFLLGGLALAALVPETQPVLAADPAAPHKLWYTSNAKRWLDPSVFATDNITLAGSTIRVTDNWAPKKEQTLEANDGRFFLLVPAMAARVDVFQRVCAQRLSPFDLCLHRQPF
jgi:hypothetical protein